MTREDILALGYSHFESPIRGTILIKQNGTVMYIEKEDALMLPNGNKISNPTKEDFEKTYTDFIAFPVIGGCGTCGKK